MQYYNITFDVCAVVVALLVMVFFTTRQRSTFTHNRIFLILSIFAIICPLCDALSSYALMHTDRFSRTYILVVTYLYMIIHNCLAYLYMLYIYTLTSMETRNISWGRRISLFVPVLVVMFMIAANSTTKAVFYLDSDLVYHRGFGMPFLYLISFYYATYGAVLCFRRRGILEVRVRVIIWIYYLTILFCCIFQYFVPSQPVEGFGISCSLLLILLVVEKPEDFVDVSVGVFDHNAFDRYCEMQFHSAVKFHILLVNLADMRFLKQTVGVNATSHIIKAMGDFFSGLVGNNVYLLNDDSFALILNEQTKEEERNIRHIINERFSRDWVYEDKEMIISVRTLTLRIPEDADEIETIYNYLDYMRDPENNRKWEMTARDVNLEDGKRRMMVSHAIRSAIEKDRFEIYYQPIYSVATGRMQSAEALVRLNDPEIGSISPVEFIQIAEQNGMIHSIGEIVLEKVCRFIADTEVLNLGIDCIDVNLSAVQCIRDDLCERVMDIIRSYGVDTRHINLEITETATGTSPRLLFHNMKQLSEQGISFSLDDFGTGYSNMHSLTGLPLEIIKFDKTIIDMASGDERGKMVLLSSVAMVKSMGMLIVAEGVETREQLDYVREVGIDYVQGYYFSKPVPEDRFLDYVRRFNKQG